jgi:Alpha-kinase family
MIFRRATNTLNTLVDSGYVVNRDIPRVGFLEDRSTGSGLDTIEEESEDEDSPRHDYHENEIFDRNELRPHKHCHYTRVRVEDFPQAFSHFSYEKSKERLMVVDLQGVFQVNADGTRAYILTDPALHKRRTRPQGKVRLGDLGRTDRGEKGMRAFWDSHVCTDACSLLGLIQKIN